MAELPSRRASPPTERRDRLRRRLRGRKVTRRSAASQPACYHRRVAKWCIPLLLLSCAPRERWFDAALQPCIGSAAPQTIDAFIEHLNTLPEDASIGCVVASLKRPLRLVATRNDTSAQPAQGDVNPRVFILDGDLVHSVVGGGRGKQLYELSERANARSTLKAELVFPLTLPVTAEHAYAHLVYSEQGTTCGFCHRQEKLDPSQAGKAVSLAIRPDTGTLVPLKRLVEELALCDAPSERCLLLAALVGIGPYEEGEFPQTWTLFGQQ